MKIYITTTSYWNTTLKESGWRSDINGAYTDPQKAIDRIKSDADLEIEFGKKTGHQVTSRLDYEENCLVWVPINTFSSPKYSIKTEKEGEGVIWRAVFEKEME